MLEVQKIFITEFNSIENLYENLKMKIKSL